MRIRFRSVAVAVAVVATLAACGGGSSPSASQSFDPNVPNGGAPAVTSAPAHTPSPTVSKTPVDNGVVPSLPSDLPSDLGDGSSLTVAQKMKLLNAIWDSFSPGEQKDYCGGYKTVGLEATAQSWADRDKRSGGLYEDDDVKWLTSWLKDHC